MTRPRVPPWGRTLSKMRTVGPVLPPRRQLPGSESFLQLWQYAFSSLVTVGWGITAPAPDAVGAIIISDALHFVGLFASVFLLGITFAKFGRPKSKLVLTERLAAYQIDGESTPTAWRPPPGGRAAGGLTGAWVCAPGRAARPSSLG